MGFSATRPGTNDGAPEVLIDGAPAPVRISMTDRAGWAVAMVSDGGELGCDLVWSAKKSALKILRTGLRRDTRLVEVEPETGTGDGWHPPTVRTVEGRTSPGWWRRYRDFPPDRWRPGPPSPSPGARRAVSVGGSRAPPHLVDVAGERPGALTPSSPGP
jgi:hypothetical protein